MYALQSFKVFARPCRRSSPSASCSSRGQWSAVKHTWSPCVLHVVGGLILASLSSLLLAASSGPGEVFCPRGVLEASLGFMIAEHQNTSCDKTLRSRTWLHDMTGFMASSINCRFAGPTLALHDTRDPNKNQQFGNTSKKTQPARRDGTCSSALRPRFCAWLLSQTRQVSNP